MKKTKTRSLTLALLGLTLTIAGPLVPGGDHLVAKGPPQAAHLTALADAGVGGLLIGTSAGEIWRRKDGLWTREGIDLGGQPVTALLGEPRRIPVGTANGLFSMLAGVPVISGRVTSLLRSEDALLAGTPEGVRWLSDGRWVAPGPQANIYSLASQTLGATTWLHAGTVGAGVLSAPRDAAAEPWQWNNRGLPAAVKVFALATTAAGKLLAGTDLGLFWQASPGESWQSLDPTLAGQRITALRLDAAADPASAQRLWVGGDAGLAWVMLHEAGAELVVEGAPTAADDAANQPPFGISAIVPSGERLWVSAGALYEYGPTQLRGWYWISAFGVLLILIAGWLMPKPAIEP